MISKKAIPLKDFLFPLHFQNSTHKILPYAIYFECIITKYPQFKKTICWELVCGVKKTNMQCLGTILYSETCRKQPKYSAIENSSINGVPLG